MKKLMTAVILSLSMFAFSTAAFADAALPPPGYRIRQAMDNVLVPLIIAIVIIVAVILYKVLRSKKKK